MSLSHEMNFTESVNGEDINLLLRQTDALLSELGVFTIPLSSPGDNITHHENRSIKNDESEMDAMHRAKEAKRRRIYRYLKKCGRKDLQSQEKELSSELVRLKQLQKEKKDRLKASRTSAYFVWKSFALRQQQERMFAEERQKQLTAAVKTQATYIDYMKTILTRQHCCTLISGNDGHLDNQRLKSTEFELVHMIIRELEANYAQIDEILRECDVVLPTTEGRVDMAHTRDSDGEVVYTQQIVKVVQPFSLGDTDRSLWTAFNAYHKVKPDFEQLDVEDAENTCAIIFRDIITLGTGKKVSVRQRSVLRRIIEKNRIVFLWKFMSEGEGDFSGIHQDETGWCSLQPSSTSTEPATVLLLCNRRSPMQFSDFSSSGLSEEQKIDFDRLLQVSDEEAWGDIASELEKLLIKDALTDIGA